MKKILYVHIGTHKTGTSSVQEFIKANASVLAKYDLYIPNAGSITPDSGHHNIAWQLRDDSRYCETYGNLDNLVSELEGIPQNAALISSEDFEYLVEKRTALKEFEQRLATIDWRVVYILALRRQKTYLRSLYSELLRHGCDIKYEEFVLRVIKDGKFCWKDGWCFYFNYSELVKTMQTKTNAPIKIVSYDRSKKNNSLCSDIINIAIPIENVKNELRAPKYIHVSSLLAGNEYFSQFEKIVTLRFLFSNFLLFFRHGVKI